MSFYRERIVKKPRKQFICAYCQEPITEEHVYASGKEDGYDFGTFRAHVKCNDNAINMCNECQYRPCDADRIECWRNREAWRE